jgi:cellulose synthase/poly-beta-1,6-N-acetylglucosamine synthase-like glycosyltransferase
LPAFLPNDPPASLSFLLEVLLGTAALLLLLPVLVLSIEIFLAEATGGSPAAAPGPRPRMAVLVPAHDEALGIAATLRAIRPQLAGGDRLLVVADNCSDETAAIARAEGAEALERHDEGHRGKGYALDAGIRALSGDPPEIVLVIDADCEVADGAIDRLARQSACAARPMQALYRMQAPRASTLHSRVAAFAWEVRNRIRPSGLHRLGLPCQLMGTGMAFPWSTISAVPLATGHLVEDLWLGIELARRGCAPVFCREALVLSRFPESVGGRRDQRTRWEHGHLNLWLGVPRLVWDALRHGNAGLLALALDLSVPPLALLALLLLAVLAGSALLALSGRTLPLQVSAVTCLLFVLAVMTGWVRFGRALLTGRDIALSGVYAIAKIPIYLRFLVARQLTWVRSRRR